VENDANADHQTDADSDDTVSPDAGTAGEAPSDGGTES
jgi:hypothetical protein